MLSKTDLKDRGWTATLLKTFLPKPDETRDNPLYKSAAPMCLYDDQRVKRIERSAKFKKLFKAAESRKKAAAKANRTKQKKLDEYVDAIKIDVPVIDNASLIERACRNYNDGHDFDPNRISATSNSDQAFLQRICVNFLRHIMTDYEYELSEIAGQVGKEAAYWKLKQKVLDAIAESYPWLTDECARQSSAK